MLRASVTKRNGEVKSSFVRVALFALASLHSAAQTSRNLSAHKLRMPVCVMERQLPGAGARSGTPPCSTR